MGLNVRAIEVENLHLSIISQFAIHMLACPSVDEVLWRLARDVVARMGFDDVVIYLLDEDKKSFHQRAAFGNKNPEANEILMPLILSVGHGIVGRVGLTGTPQRIPDVSLHPEYIVDNEARGSELAVPMVVDGEVIGVIDSENAEIGFYTEQDERTLIAIASIAATKISQTRSVEMLSKERGQLAQRVEERTAELTAANIELARASRLKDEFMATMSHELRTPLNTVLGMCEALQEGAYGSISSDQQSSLSLIHESGDHLLALINDILDLSMIEAGQLELALAPCSIQDLCESSVRMIRSDLRKKQLKFTLDDQSSQGFVVADYRRLQQALVSLLSNAVKFTPDGGELGLSISKRREGEDEFLSMQVWDKGIGIPEGEIQNLFVPFQQLDGGLARQHAGMGLGLVIAKRMAELHGGALHLGSVEGEGTRVTITLPLVLNRQAPIGR